MRHARVQEASGVLGSFAHVDLLIRAVKDAKEKKFDVVDVFSPVPVEEVMAVASPKQSPVRFVTFTGGLFGILGGFSLAIATSLIWNMIVGGKPVTHHVPFVVVGFEALVLLGALFTFVAILFFGKLPYRRFPGPAYRPEFSREMFGLWIMCPDGDEDRARQFLVEAGATAVRRLGDDEAGGDA